MLPGMDCTRCGRKPLDRGSWLPVIGEHLLAAMFIFADERTFVGSVQRGVSAPALPPQWRQVIEGTVTAAPANAGVCCNRRSQCHCLVTAFLVRIQHPRADGKAAVRPPRRDTRALYPSQSAVQAVSWFSPVIRRAFVSFPVNSERPCSPWKRRRGRNVFCWGRRQRFSRRGWSLGWGVYQ